MKKLLIAAALTLVSIGAFAQGQINFANGGTTRITNGVTLATAGVNTKVGVYTADGFGAAVGGMALQTQTNVFSAGLYSGGVRILGIPAGQVTVQIRAWAATVNNYTSYENAVANIASDSSLLFGVSAPFNYTLTPSGTPPATIISAGLTPIILMPAVPEPSSIALGLLGLGAVALFRRRK